MLGAGSPNERPSRSLLSPLAVAAGLGTTAEGVELGKGTEGVDGVETLGLEATGLL